MTVRQPASRLPSLTPSPNDHISFAQPSHSPSPSPTPTTADIIPYIGVSRGGLTLLRCIEVAIALIVGLVICIALIIAVYKILIAMINPAKKIKNAMIKVVKKIVSLVIWGDMITAVEKFLIAMIKAVKKIRSLVIWGDMITAVDKILIAMIKAVKKITIKAYRQIKAAGTDIYAQITGQLLDLPQNCLEEGNGINIRTYTREELARATKNFTTIVGQGVSGFVYHANLPGNRIGAVKRATDLDPDLFKQELSVLLRLPPHPHFVNLIGLCLQEGERILVFEFISNGSLYDRLHTERGLVSPLSWEARIDIAYEVALALEYLHEEANPPILHRDVKSANVLLGDDNHAKLADFGLSKLGPKGDQFTITAVRGSYGYMDPQYMKTRRFSAKSDVYSFGVLLLELLTGFKSLHEDTPLAEWTETYRFSVDIDIFMKIVDRNMTYHINTINTMELQNMIKIANLCLAEVSEERPSMREIVNMMQETRNRNSNVNLCDGGEDPLLLN